MYASRASSSSGPKSRAISSLATATAHSALIFSLADLLLDPLEEHRVFEHQLVGVEDGGVVAALRLDARADLLQARLGAPDGVAQAGDLPFHLVAVDVAAHVGRADVAEDQRRADGHAGRAGDALDDDHVGHVEIRRAGRDRRRRGRDEPAGTAAVSPHAPTLRAPAEQRRAAGSTSLGGRRLDSSGGLTEPVGDELPDGLHALRAPARRARAPRSPSPWSRRGGARP